MTQGALHGLFLSDIVGVVPRMDSEPRYRTPRPGAGRRTSRPRLLVNRALCLWLEIPGSSESFWKPSYWVPSAIFCMYIWRKLRHKWARRCMRQPVRNTKLSAEETEASGLRWARASPASGAEPGLEPRPARRKALPPAQCLPFQNAQMMDGFNNQNILSLILISNNYFPEGGANRT